MKNVVIQMIVFLSLTALIGCAPSDNTVTIASQKSSTSLSSTSANPTPTPKSTTTPTPTATPSSDVNVDVDIDATPTPSVATKIVYKEDQSLYASINSASTSLEDDATGLDGIKIYSSKKMRDEDLSHAAFSGDSGIRNAYEIAESDVTAAQNAGYKLADSVNLVNSTSCKSLIGSKTMVALIMGQSNASNITPTLYRPTSNVYNFFQGECYPATDPMLGTGGYNGTIWTRMADQLVKSGKYDNVILINIAVGGSAISSWIPGSTNNALTVAAIQQVQNADIEITHILWDQGESDAAFSMSGMIYTLLFQSMLNDIRDRGVSAPIYVCVATYMMGQISLEIELAQMQLVNETSKIRSGVNTDQFGMGYRQADNVHFSDVGAETIAAEWVKIL